MIKTLNKVTMTEHNVIYIIKAINNKSIIISSDEDKIFLLRSETRYEWLFLLSYSTRNWQSWHNNQIRKKE